MRKQSIPGPSSEEVQPGIEAIRLCERLEKECLCAMSLSLSLLIIRPSPWLAFQEKMKFCASKLLIHKKLLVMVTELKFDCGLHNHIHVL